MARRIEALLISLLLAACSKEVVGPPPAPTAPPPPVASTAPTEVAPSPFAPAPAKPTLAELERTALCAWFDAFNAHDTKKLGDLYVWDAAFMSLGPGGWAELQGSYAIASSYASTFTAMPDIKAAPVRVLAKDDLLVVEWAAVGTNTGEIDGGRPTNKKAGVWGVSLYWFNPEGFITRVRTVHDDVTIAQQLGKMPGKARELATLPAGDPVWITATNTEAEAGLIDQMLMTWPLAWNKHDAKAYAATLSDRALHRDLSGPVDFQGKRANLKELAIDTRAFPDRKVTIDRAWAFSPNIVVAEFTFSGTMKGDYGALRATKKPILGHGIEVDELINGKLLYGSTYENGTELLDQLGLLPKPRGKLPVSSK
jgi:predicted ester cyclase